MSTVETLRCDECGKLRVNDSNHWLAGEFLGNLLFIGGMNEDIVKEIEALELKKGKTNIIHLCGQECAMKWVGIKIGEL